jgi:hypothetical protein
MLAGNSNTLMTLWPVDDEGAARFIPSFVAKALAGHGLMAALAATKREFASGAHGARLADPRLRAAFVQCGVSMTLPAPPKSAASRAAVAPMKKARGRSHVPFHRVASAGLLAR